MLIFTSLGIFTACEEEAYTNDDFNYLTFESSTYSAGVELNGSTDFNVEVLSSKKSSSDRTFNVSVVTELSTADPASYVVPGTVTIPANDITGILSITISDLNISEAGETLVIALEEMDGLFIGDSITLEIFQSCPLNEVNLSITFDDYPEETSWELLDSNQNIIESTSAGDYEGESSFAKRFCLEDGTYNFTIKDSWGDGTGDYTLIYKGTILASGGGFGDMESTTFDVSME